MALFKNKDTDKKRKGENVIGKIIYGFLLFAPLMSILFTSLYTVFNKNAFESYYGETINQENYIAKSFNELKTGKEYHFINNNLLTVNETNGYYRLNVENVSIYNSNTDYSTTNNIRFYSYPSTSATSMVVSLYNNNSLITSVTVSINYTNITFTLLSKTSDNITNFTQFFNCIYEIEYNKYSYLDNAFEYGMYKTEQSNIYNWSKTTGTYTVLQNVCNGIGITNTFVPMLMAYWLIISIVYFIFDIALILIWAVHDKIHALKDAI